MKPIDMETQKELTISEKLNYLFSKINWAGSFLDAQAIQYMNELPKEVSELEDNYMTLGYVLKQCLDASHRVPLRRGPLFDQ